MIHTWTRALLEGASSAGERGRKRHPEIDEEQAKNLLAKIGELAAANGFFVQKAQTMDRHVKWAMNEPANPALSIGKQRRFLSISPSSFSYQLKGETALYLMSRRKIEKLFRRAPVFGNPPTPRDIAMQCPASRGMTWHLHSDGHLVNEKRVRRPQRLIGQMPILQKSIPSKAARGTRPTPTSCVIASGSPEPGLGGRHC